MRLCVKADGSRTWFDRTQSSACVHVFPVTKCVHGVQEKKQQLTKQRHKLSFASQFSNDRRHALVDPEQTDFVCLGPGSTTDLKQFLWPRLRHDQLGSITPQITEPPAGPAQTIEPRKSGGRKHRGRARILHLSFELQIFCGKTLVQIKEQKEGEFVRVPPCLLPSDVSRIEEATAEQDLCRRLLLVLWSNNTVENNCVFSALACESL